MRPTLRSDMARKASPSSKARVLWVSRYARGLSSSSKGAKMAARRLCMACSRFSSGSHSARWRYSCDTSRWHATWSVTKPSSKKYVSAFSYAVLAARKHAWERRRELVGTAEE